MTAAEIAEFERLALKAQVAKFLLEDALVEIKRLIEERK